MFKDDKLESGVPFFSLLWSFHEFERAPNNPNDTPVVMSEARLRAIFTGQPLEELGPLDYDPVAEEERNRKAHAWHCADLQLAIEQLLPGNLATDAHKNMVEELYDHALVLSGSQSVALDFIGKRLSEMGVNRQQRIEKAREYVQGLTLSGVKQRLVTDALRCA